MPSQKAGPSHNPTPGGLTSGLAGDHQEPGGLGATEPPPGSVPISAHAMPVMAFVNFIPGYFHSSLGWRPGMIQNMKEKNKLQKHRRLWTSKTACQIPDVLPLKSTLPVGLGLRHFHQSVTPKAEALLSSLSSGTSPRSFSDYHPGFEETLLRLPSHSSLQFLPVC